MARCLIWLYFVMGEPNFTMSESKHFSWPSGKRAALSLSFDDARDSQLSAGVPVLDKNGVRATVYVVMWAVERNLEGWRDAHVTGHEMGNHTISHPCSGNFEFSRHNALEDYTLERMDLELTGASEKIAATFGSTPTTFAYPCGQSYVGRGDQLQSYIPLVARHFTAGRLFRSERPNDPAYCDLSQIFGWDFDNQPFEAIKEMIDGTIATGGWLVLAGHDVGDNPAQAVTAEILDEVCRYANDPANGIWVDTVATIGDYVKNQRGLS